MSFILGLVAKDQAVSLEDSQVVSSWEFHPLIVSVSPESSHSVLCLKNMDPAAVFFKEMSGEGGRAGSYRWICKLELNCILPVE